MPVTALFSDLLRQCRGAASVRVLDPSIITTDPSAATGTFPKQPMPCQPRPPLETKPHIATKAVQNTTQVCHDIPSVFTSPSSKAIKATGATRDCSPGTALVHCTVSSDALGTLPPGQMDITPENNSPGASYTNAMAGNDLSSVSSIKERPSSGSKDRLVHSDSYRATRRTSQTQCGSRADVFDSSKVGLAVKEPLSTLAWEMLAPEVKQLGLHEGKLRCFLRQVESAMPLTNKYHNALHVLEVTQLMYIQTLEGGPIADICADPVVRLSALLAALCHDYSHPGFSTAFLVSTGHELVERYGRDSTLEKMHLHCLRQLCDDPATGFMAGLDADVQERVLNYAERIILATDMSQHMSFVSAEAPEDPEELVVFKLQFAMKCADLSHCVRKFSIHYAFVEKLKAEFYNQGDKERELKLPVSPGMDRKEDYRQMAYSQAYFLSNFILPLYTAWSKHTNGNAMVGKLRAVLERNITSWKLLCAEPDTTGYDVKNAHSGSIPVRKLVREADALDAVSKSLNNLVMQEQVQAMYGLL